MFRTITAKYPGACRRCHAPIYVGDTIRYGGAGRIYHLAATCAAARGSFDSATDTAEPSSGVAPSARRSVYTRFSSGAEVFTNAAGRCEDAPCCGCCS
jgi:hypothetical protein